MLQIMTSASSLSAVNGENLNAESLDSDSDCEEADHFEKIVNVFRYYRAHSLLKIGDDYESFCKLPDEHKELLKANFPSHLKSVKSCVLENDRFLRQVLAGIGRIFENKDHDSDVEASQLRPASGFDMEKLQGTLKQISRDWSSEGKPERERCYEPVIQEILRRLPDVSKRKDVKVLVPGAGLGRLALDIASLGFECQGNEFSLFMIFVSNFILNRCKEVNFRLSKCKLFLLPIPKQPYIRTAYVVGIENKFEFETGMKIEPQVTESCEHCETKCYLQFALSPRY